MLDCSLYIYFHGNDNLIQLSATQNLMAAVGTDMSSRYIINREVGEVKCL